ncbi:hypothetical protein SMC26_39535 [Actinomadura fulvescens]|uniref:Holliday junction resolvase n=1 Tax=Actinomadura fulvescens TaxID=46160 RepID=A0ABP6CFP1_9ACTN
MSNPNKRRGTEWETAGTRFLRAEVPDGDDIRRVAQTGRLDIGDVHAAPFALEFKNTAKLELAAYVDQAEAEAHNAGLPFGAAVVKRRGKGPGAGYVVLSLATFARLLAYLRANTPADRGR